MSRTAQATPQSKELVFKGELVLQTIATLKEQMQATLEQTDEMQLNIAEASDFDLAFLQLLCSGHRTAIRCNKSLRLIGKIPEDFHRKVVEAGFARHAGCHPDSQSSCLWTGHTG